MDDDEELAGVRRADRGISNLFSRVGLINNRECKGVEEDGLRVVETQSAFGEDPRRLLLIPLDLEVHLTTLPGTAYRWITRLGDFNEAVLELREAVNRIPGYAGSDPELNALVVALTAEEGRWAAPAPETLRKVAFATANYSLRSRGPEGKAGR